ncbi:MAG TPA: hypothetical protein VGE77_05910 [Nocardioides sp.]
MPWVRRSAVVAFLVGISAWLVSTVTDDHSAQARVLISVTYGHGLVTSDLPRLLAWGVLVAVGVRALR